MWSKSERKSRSDAPPAIRFSAHEPQAILEGLGPGVPLAGLYSHGEIGAFDSDDPRLAATRFHNCTLVMCALVHRPPAPLRDGRRRTAAPYAWTRTFRGGARQRDDVTLVGVEVCAPLKA